MSLEFKSKLNTRYCESDALGHINSVSYYIYIEQARVEFMKGTGITPNVNSTWPFILVSSKCDYKKQLFIDENICIYTTVSEIGNSSFTLTHEIKREDNNQLIAIGNSIIVYFDFDRQKSKKLDNDILDKLSKYKF